MSDFITIEQLEHGKDCDGRPWPYERCKSAKCKGRRNVVSFGVPDEVWAAVVPDGLNVVCLACFDEMAQDKGIRYRDVLEVHSPTTWEDL